MRVSAAVFGAKHIILYVVIAVVVVGGAWFLMRGRGAGA
jgi:hypothetical protein